ncbi:MAG: hypothetical protein NTU88_07590 [Armatimonadetes bacterium]|nr:hypothetical protein [Armatimonadota bacterium]
MNRICRMGKRSAPSTINHQPFPHPPPLLAKPPTDTLSYLGFPWVSFTFGYQVSGIEYPASSTEHRVSSIQHPASSIEYRASSIEYPASRRTNKWTE